MKRKLQFATAVIAIFALQQGNAQLSGANAFMIGDYVEVGISEHGYEGAVLDDAIPTHYRGATGKLGFVANPAADGWVEYNGDFYLPGSPENGFGLTYTVDGVTYNRGNNATGIAEISGSITDFSESADSVMVKWVGVTPDSLELTVVYELQKDQHFYTTTMSLDNIGSESFTDVYYYRNLDPDINQDILWGFSTTNTIESQAGMADDSVRVIASQDSGWEAIMTFHAYGENWRGFTGGFSNRDGSLMWNGGGGLNTTEGYSMMSDQAIGIAYKIESLPPGRAGAVVFSNATAFKHGVTFSEGGGETESISENTIAFDIYPNPTQDDFVNITIADSYTYQILDLKGSVVLSGFGNGNGTIDLSSLDKGVYLLNLTQNSSTATERIVLK